MEATPELTTPIKIFGGSAGTGAINFHKGQAKAQEQEGSFQEKSHGYVLRF